MAAIMAAIAALLTIGLGVTLTSLIIFGPMGALVSGSLTIVALIAFTRVIVVYLPRRLYGTERLMRSERLRR